MSASKLTAIALGVALLAGCQSTGGPSRATDPAAANILAGGIAEAIGRCWFGEGETAFASYIYTPETVGGLPRILLAPKDDPGGKPVLVVSPIDSRQVELFGPLLNSAQGPRIRADIDRWRSGGTGCGS